MISLPYIIEFKPDNRVLIGLQIDAFDNLASFQTGLHAVAHHWSCDQAPISASMNNGLLVVMNRKKTATTHFSLLYNRHEMIVVIGGQSL